MVKCSATSLSCTSGELLSFYSTSVRSGDLKLKVPEFYLFFCAGNPYLEPTEFYSSGVFCHINDTWSV